MQFFFFFHYSVLGKKIRNNRNIIDSVEKYEENVYVSCYFRYNIFFRGKHLKKNSSVNRKIKMQFFFAAADDSMYPKKKKIIKWQKYDIICTRNKDL